MAPQQNSTLIDDNLESCPSLLNNIPEEIIHYSPILPPKNKENLDKNNNNNNNNNNKNYNSNKNNNQQHQNVNYISKWELTEKEQRHYYKNKHCRSRSISLYGVNSTVEQGHKEITIWLDDEPRYVSGVTNKTTCNDIIKALIDDEIGNGNYEYCQQLKGKRKAGAASRDYSDYVITECWRGIERSYDGNMRILPVWNAWSRVHNEIQLSLKHHKDIQDPMKPLKTNTTLSSIRDYICKFLSFGKNKKRNTKTKKSNKSLKFKIDKKEQRPIANDAKLFPNKDIQDSKEKLRETYSQNIGNKINRCHHIMPPTSEDTRTTTISDTIKLNKEKLYKLSETRASVRKRQSGSSRRKHKKHRGDGKRDRSNAEPHNCLRKRKDSCIRSSVRNKLAQKSVEMNELFEREYALTRQLTNKCKMYKQHNEQYTRCDGNLEMSVGQIQRSIENCAKDIIQTEHELLEVKNEIKHDISFINNLKRLTIDADFSKCSSVPLDLASELDKKTATATTTTTNVNSTSSTNCVEHMLFVDNIYEFCDNNASMLV